MPYGSVKETPDWVQQRGGHFAAQWREVWNSVYEECHKKGNGDCEKRAFKAAAAVAKRGRR